MDVFKRALKQAMARSSELRATVRLIEQSTGFPIPLQPFPATITGKVLPQFRAGDPPDGSRPTPNSPFVPLDPCTDPAGIYDCADESADTHLPCGVSPVRYKWEAPLVGLSSDALCGFRNISGVWTPWKQAFYAVNAIHHTQDPTIDYDYTPVNMLVIMAFGPIGLLTGDDPTWGFFFRHMSDPPGANACGPAVPPCGCCIWFDGNRQRGACMSEENCAFYYSASGGVWYPNPPNATACPDAIPPNPGEQTQYYDCTEGVWPGPCENI